VATWDRTWVRQPLNQFSAILVAASSSGGGGGAPKQECEDASTWRAQLPTGGLLMNPKLLRLCAVFGQARIKK